jgi:hypothetical protein
MKESIKENLFFDLENKFIYNKNEKNPKFFNGIWKYYD